MSSGEAELVSVVRGACEGLGVRSLEEDLGCRPRIAILTDASAAVGMTHRSGVGRVRHLDTRLLWVQDKVREKEITVGKVDGKLNPADVLTKYLGSDIMSEHLLRMACVMCAGRAALAPTVKKEEEERVYFVQVDRDHKQLGTCPLPSAALAPLPYSARPFPGGPGSASCPWDTKPGWLPHQSGSSGHTWGAWLSFLPPGPPAVAACRVIPGGARLSFLPPGPDGWVRILHRRVMGTGPPVLPST